MANPRGIALTIGLDRLSASGASECGGELKGGKNDALAMEALASRQFETTCLTDGDATMDAVAKAVRAAAAVLHDGDFFLLTFSGHGQHYRDLNDIGGRYPERGFDESWCLYDGVLLDDAINRALREFRPGVRVLIVSDSCYSGGILERLVRWRKEWLREAEETRSEVHPSDGAGGPENLATTRPEVNAAVLLLAASEDDQQAGDGKPNSVFTDALLEVWSGGNFKGDYEAFLAQIKEKITADQNPVLLPLGKGWESFIKQRPFTL